MGIEIKVNISNLALSENDLSDLLSELSSQKLAVTIAHAEGAMINEINETIKQLNLIGTSLCTLVEKTKRAVTNARMEFKNSDRSAAQHFRNGK